MRLCCLAFGTRGDVEPVLRVALAWLEACGGRDVTLVTHRAHGSWLPAAPGVTYAWVETAPCLPRDEDLSELWSEAQGAACLEAARGSAALVFDLFALEGVHLADVLGLPCAVVQAYPLPTGAPRGWPRALAARQPELSRRLSAAESGDLSMADVEHWLWPALLDDRWLRYRAAVEGRPVRLAHGLADFWRNRRAPRVLYGFDEALLPRPGYWPPSAVVLGAFLRGAGSSDHDADAVAAFLDAAPDPGVLLSLGAAASRDAGCLARGAAGAIYGGLRDALERSGRVAVVQDDGYGFAAAFFAHADDVLVVREPVDHAPIMRRCAVAVHHGGAGHAHRAAEAGCAQVVIPFFYDQFAWAEALAFKGVGVRATPETVGPAVLAALGAKTRLRAACLARTLAPAAAAEAARAVAAAAAEVLPPRGDAGADDDDDDDDEGLADVELDCGLVLALPSAAAAENDHIAREIFDEGCYGEALAGLPAGAFVVDVGAHCGLFAVLCALRVTSPRLLCLEPNATTRPALARNLARYCPSAARVLPYAAGDVDGEATLTAYPAMPGNATLRRAEKERRHFPGQDAADLFRGATETPVVVRRLDALFDVENEDNAPRIDLLKIDVEGHEYSVLDGARATLARSTDRVVLEVHDIDGRLAACSDLLASLGFTTTARPAPGCLPLNRLLFAVRVREDGCYC